MFNIYIKKSFDSSSNSGNIKKLKDTTNKSVTQIQR